MSAKLPFWLRTVLLVGVVILAAGVGLFAYRYFTRPATLTVAVGSIDGEAAKAMSEMAGEFAVNERSSAAQGHRQRNYARSCQRLFIR